MVVSEAGLLLMEIKRWTTAKPIDDRERDNILDVKSSSANSCLNLCPAAEIRRYE